MNRQTPVLTSDEFGKFFSEYKNRFVSIAYGYVHDTDIAKDIVTDSFMYLWEHREQVNICLLYTSLPRRRTGPCWPA